MDALPDVQYPSSRMFCISCKGGRFGAGCKSCPKGFSRSEDQAADVCLPCARGRYTGDAGGSSTCALCPEGRFGPAGTSGVCRDCPVGMFQDAKGSLECHNCPVNTFSKFGGKKAESDCLDCDLHHAPHTITDGAQGVSDPMTGCICEKGYYQAGNLNDAQKRRKMEKEPNYAVSVDVEMARRNPLERNLCIKCEEGAFCDHAGVSLSSLVSRRGYWRPANDSHHFVSCLSTIKVRNLTELGWAKERCCANCSEVANASWNPDWQCKAGYRGAMCRACREDHVFLLNECIPCKGGGKILSALVTLGVFCGSACFVLIIYLLCMTKKAGVQTTNAMRVFGQVNVISGLSSSASPPHPPPPLRTLLILTLFHFSILSTPRFIFTFVPLVLRSK